MPSSTVEIIHTRVTENMHKVRAMGEHAADTNDIVIL